MLEPSHVRAQHVRAHVRVSLTTNQCPSDCNLVVHRIIFDRFFSARGLATVLHLDENNNLTAC